MAAVCLHDLDHLCLDGEGQTALCSDLQAFSDGLLDVCQRLLTGRALGHASRDSGALDDPDAIFVPIDSHLELHAHLSSDDPPEPGNAFQCLAPRRAAVVNRSCTVYFLPVGRRPLADKP